MAEMTEFQPPTITAVPCAPGTIYRGMRIASLGHLKGKTARVTARFGFPAVGLVVAGEGFFSVGPGPRRAVGPGTLFGVYPDATFDYGPYAWWDEYYVGFTGPGATELVECGLIPRDGQPRRVTDLTGAIARFKEVIRVFRRARVGDTDRATLLGQALLLELFTARGRGSRRVADPVEAILARCRARPQDAFDFPTLAERSGISYSLLRQGIHRRTGFPPAKYVTRLRCEAACVRLATSAAPIQQIAREVGIPDPYAFSRTFQRTIGLSPTHYRAMQHSYG